MDFTEQELKLAQFFVEREGRGVLDVIRDVDFFESGMLDSLDFVSLAVFIESKFGKKIDITKPEVLQAMRRFKDLCALILS